MLASGDVKPLPDDDSPSEDDESLRIGDVLAKMARRQLASISQIDAAESNLSMLVDTCITEFSQRVEDSFGQVDSMEHNWSIVFFVSDTHRAELQVIEDDFLQHFVNSTASVEESFEETREMIRQARLATSADAERVDMRAAVNLTKLTDFRAAVMSRARARALARVERSKIAASSPGGSGWRRLSG
jgi:hypothetical protein